MTARILSVSMLAALGLPPTQAQTPPSFEVATIKLAPPGIPTPPVKGRFTISSRTLVGLIRTAFAPGVNGTIEVRGGPDWADRDRYDVVALAPGNPSPSDQKIMLQNLLQERFALKVHFETKEVDVYSLVLARSDGKLGPKVQVWNGKCFDQEPRPAGPDPKTPRCAGGYRPPGMTVLGGSMAAVADFLSMPMGAIDRPVVDRTGLSGIYDVALEFPFEAPRPGQAPVVDPSAPSIFTALQEQLGLKLQPGRGSVDVLVVDAAERPSEN